MNPTYLDLTHFSCVNSIPKFGLSSNGDICFCNTTDGGPALDKHRQFFLKIYRADGSTVQTLLPSPPAMIEGTLQDGISCIAPRIIDDQIYLGLSPEWMYGLHGPSYCIKVDWTGKLLWAKKYSEGPYEGINPIITLKGRQYVFYCNANGKALMCLSKEGEIQWTIQEKWLNDLSPLMYSLPDECILLIKVSTKPSPGGSLSKLYIINSEGKVIKRTSSLQIKTLNNLNININPFYLYQSPVNPPQRYLLYLPPSLPYWTDDNPPKLIYEPQEIMLFDPVSDRLERKEFIVGNVVRFLWDKEQQLLLFCADRKHNDISRIDYQNGSIQYHTYHGNHDTQEPYPPFEVIDFNNQHKEERAIIEPSPKLINHCLPVITELREIIFCHSGTTAVCMSSDWKEKWRVELPRGACDMKLTNNRLFIMIYNEEEHRAELHKLLLH